MKTNDFFARLRDVGLRGFSATRRGLAAALGLGRRALLSARSSERARRWKRPMLRALRVTAGAAILALIAVLAGSVCFERVMPGTVGVKQANWGSGIEERDYPPGLYFGPPGLSTWHHLDARTRFVTFAPGAEGGAYPPLELRTAQGNTVEIAATVPYGIVPGRAHRIVADGKKLGHELSIKSTIERVLQRELALLEVVEYFDVDKRLELCERALARLNAELDAHHVAAERILVSGFLFPSTFELKMQDEQLASQTVRTNAVLARLKARKLENAFVAQELARAEQSLGAELAAEFAAQQQVAHYAIEGQKVENQRLTHDLEVEKNEFLARLTREFQAARIEERDRPLALQKQQNATAALALGQEVLDLAGELGRAFEAERLALGVDRLEAQRRANKLTGLALEREGQELAAELALSLAGERALQEDALLAVQREAQEQESRIERESATAVAQLVVEGEQARQAAEALREELRAGILASPGGRIWLAREAASNLTIQRVTLDANDPRVPSVLDLDALVKLLVGEEQGD